MLRRTRDAELREVAERRRHHAPAAERTAVAHRVEVDAQAARGVEHGHAIRHRAPPSARGEHDGRAARTHAAPTSGPPTPVRPFGTVRACGSARGPLTERARSLRGPTRRWLRTAAAARPGT